MDLLVITRWIAWIGLALGLLGVLLRLGEIMRRPFKRDLSRAQGSAWRGVLYAFTLGMAPWEKESTRLHWIAYLRGIFFHVGIFMAFGVFFASPWLEQIGAIKHMLVTFIRWLAAAVCALGAIFGFSGIYTRLAGKNERLLSLPDDYFAVGLTSLFSALACAVVLVAGSSISVTGLMAAFYIVTAVLCIYVPFGKIRHCVYFFYAKFFFGFGFGHRNVLGQAHRDSTE
jgi:hypothetical protein